MKPHEILFQKYNIKLLVEQLLVSTVLCDAGCFLISQTHLTQSLSHLDQELF